MSKLHLYIDYFKDKVKEKFFSKKEKTKPETDYDEIRFENWVFSAKDTRFENEDESDYKTMVDAKSGEIKITAKRKNVYAWTVNKCFRYEDFAFDFTVCFNEQGVQYKTERAGTAAAGLLFRYINTGVFYAVLVSDQGWIRMDVMINGTANTVLAWTRLANFDVENLKNEYHIKIIAVSNKFHILVDDAWLASVNDDVIQSAGKIALAIQNWEAFSQSTVRFKNISLNSVLSAVENLDTEAIQKSEGNYDAHINLAHTFYAMGRSDLASAELNKAESVKALEAKDAITAVRIYFSRSQFDQAEQAYKRAISASLPLDDSIRKEASEELASIYYAINNFETLGIFLKEQKENNSSIFEHSAILQNFTGHYFNFKGEHQNASRYYEKAFSLNNTEGLFAFNCALEYEALHDEEKEKDWLRKAAYTFLQVENYTELAKVLNKLENISADDEITLSLLGKFYFGVENFTESLGYFKKLCEEKKTKDASNWYLYALLIKESDYDTYLKSLRKACTLDKTSSLYFFRLAEALFYAGKDCTKELEKSLELDNKNAWSYNLKALVAIKNKNFLEAEKNLLEARKILPDEIDLLINFVEVKRLQGKLDTILALFDFDSDTVDLAAERNRGKALHALANALYKDGRFDEADTYYKDATKILGDKDYDLIVNQAQNSMEIGYLNEADALLVKALDMNKTLEVYRLIARLSTLKGNYLRAKACIDEGLENFPDNTDLLFDLAMIQTQCNKVAEAKESLARLSKLEKSERVTELKVKIESI